MPQTNQDPNKSFVRFVLAALAGLVFGTAVGGLQRSRAVRVEPRPLKALPLADEPWEWGEERKLKAPHRYLMAAALVSLFFAGAAFTAGAGNKTAQLLEGTDSTPTATTSAPAPAPAPASAPAVTPSAPTTPPQPVASAPPASTPAPTAASASAPQSASSAPAVDPSASPGRVPDSSETSQAAAAAGLAVAAASPAAPASAARGPAAPVTSVANQVAAHVAASAPAAVHLRAASRARPRLAQRPAPLDPEATAPDSAAIVWLNSPLPDPTPPAKRLSPAFARQLLAASSEMHVDWALVLGVLRARGTTGAVPADPAALRGLVQRLSASLRQGTNGWDAVLAVTGDTALADRAVALERYDRAVSLFALVYGLEYAKHDLAQRLLSDPNVSIYSGGRDDIAANKVDVRVLAVIAYLRDTFGSVEVSCLISGHRLYARPGVVSAHIYGRAVDIASLGGVAVEGHQQPGGLTEHAVRDLLLLPAELEPRQVISLLGLGGPSFPLADHYDHVHIGY